METDNPSNPHKTIRIIPLHAPQSDDLSSTTTAEERINMMWQLALDAWAMKGEPVVEQRLPRHVVRVIRLKEKP